MMPSFFWRMMRCHAENQFLWDYLYSRYSPIPIFDRQGFKFCPGQLLGQGYKELFILCYGSVCSRSCSQVVYCLRISGYSRILCQLLD